MRHFSGKRTSSGIRALARRGGSSTHSFGRYSSKLSGQARSAPSSTVDTATWQFAILLSAPQYWRVTPTERLPCLRKLVSSSARMPVRTGTSARSRAHTGFVSRRVGDEVLERLITDWVAAPTVHRLYGLPPLSLKSASRY
jgi:hypothetical protein